MSKWVLFLISSFLSYTTFAQAKLPNGWSLSPAGNSITLGDLPLNMDVSASGKYIAVTNNGVSTQYVQLIDAKKQKMLASIPIAKSWLGLKFSKDEKYLYVAGGNDDRILKYAIKNDQLIPMDSLVLGKKTINSISPTGIDIDDAAGKLYIVTKGDEALYIIDLKKWTVEKRVQLSAEAYTCLLSADHKTLFISLWGGSQLLYMDTRTATVKDSVSTPLDPNDLCKTKNGKYLFIANSQNNVVSVIDIAKKKIIETLDAALYPNALTGATTNSIVLSADEKTLYIANADNNCLAVYDVSEPGKSMSKGFIPVGWYPTCVRTVGKTILVTNGKGMSSLPNPEGPQPIRKNVDAKYKKADTRSEQYIGSLFKGSLSFIEEPGTDQLAVYSKQVYANTPYTKNKEMQTDGEAGNPIPTKVGDPSPIKHVFYIIKENRTYDQVLSDMPQGNGDTSLLLFGKKITPNEHAIAKQFVLLDNFYVDGEVSVDGHNWSMAAYANDFIEKTWPTSYGGRGNVDYNGKRTIGLPEKGFIWDYAMRAGISIRNYGEFLDDDGREYLKGFFKYNCPGYAGWDLSIADTTRERVWQNDFDSLLSKKAVPQLNIIYLPTDHTEGLRKGALSPFAFVAGNDLALGLLVEHLSKSTVWSESAVFVLEDDAQNGPDHVDAHRSTAFVAGGYVKRGFVDHTMYSTSGMLRTMELILGLPPMSQYDAAATPMWRSFAVTVDTSSFIHKAAKVDLAEHNLAINKLSKQSAAFDFSRPDLAPDMELNEIIWKSIKGEMIPFPGPKRAAFVAIHQKDGDD